MIGDSNRGRLAIGAGDNGGRNIVNSGPVDFRRVRKLPHRPGLRTRAESDGNLVVIPQKRHTVRDGGLFEHQQRRVDLSSNRFLYAGNRFFEVRTCSTVKLGVATRPDPLIDG
jgi:hypothetical protein